MVAKIFEFWAETLVCDLTCMHCKVFISDDKKYSIFGVTFSLKVRVCLIISIDSKFRGCIIFSVRPNCLKQTVEIFEILLSA